MERKDFLVMFFIFFRVGGFATFVNAEFIEGFVVIADFAMFENFGVEIPVADLGKTGGFFEDFFIWDFWTIQE